MKASIVCCKLFLVIISIIFLLLSLVSIAFGIIVMIGSQDWTTTERILHGGSLCSSLARSISITLVVFGVVMFLLSLFAFCGSCCTNCCRISLILFSVLLGLLMVAEITMFCLIYIEDSPLHEKSTTDILTQTASDIVQGNLNVVKDADQLLKKYTCDDPVEDVLKKAKPIMIIAFAVELVLQGLQMLCALVIYNDKRTENYHILTETASPQIALVNQSTSQQMTAPPIGYYPITA